MVSITQFSIRSSTSSLNISKGGSTSLYVDQAHASADDLNDGYSWDRPYKTIGGALADADPWTEVYIKTGTYTENVIIPHENIILHGLVQDGASKVTIKPTSGVALTCAYGQCAVHGIEFDTTNSDGIDVSGKCMKIYDCDFHIASTGLTAHSCIHVDAADEVSIYGNVFSGGGDPNVIGILVDGGSYDVGILGNYFTGFGGGVSVGYAVAINDAQRVAIVPLSFEGRMMPNRFNDNYLGIYFYSQAGYRGHSVHGCGFWSNDYYDVYDPNTPSASGIVIDGNFYGYTGWFTDSSHTGISDIIVDCYTNHDFHPLASLQSHRVTPIPRIEYE